MGPEKYKYLRAVDSPDDLKNLAPEELAQYSEELRRFIIAQLAGNPGHLGSSLGTVELTVALHYVFSTPYDRLVWDVGHQAYAHKIITGRRDVFHTNRKLNGISGFPKMSESEYDAFGGGHTSVSISAAYGMAEAAKLLGEDRRVVAVIGDGALTGGLAFEGLNNAGISNTDIIVVLNDNNMSIDPNVGALKEYLLNISTSKRYNEIKKRAWNTLSPIPSLRRLIQKTGNALKLGLLQQSNLFESLNFRYFGPVDGHDVQQMVKVLSDLKQIPGPKLLHVLTVKGKGYHPAENNQRLWHAPGRFDPQTGERLATPADGPALYQDVFGHTLVELARGNEKIVGVTPAMPTGCSMNFMMAEMPQRCFDVGIAEGHAVTFSAGMAASGLKPYCNIYSSFMQRAYDNVIHDVALQNLGVVFCLDRAGLVGEDGATHHGLFDLACFMPVPNMVISSPMNERDLRNLMYSAQKYDGPFMIRYPRGSGVGARWDGKPEEYSVGKATVIEDGTELALLTFGPLGNVAKRAADRARMKGISVFHADLRFAKPLDSDLLHEVGKRFTRVVTVEDGVIKGGVGSAVQAFMADNGYDLTVIKLGVPDTFIEQGTQSELYSLCGLDQEAIYRQITSITDVKGH